MYFCCRLKVTVRKTAKFRGLEVVYSQSGGGETVVLLHGFLEERGMWQEMVPELSKSHNVIAIDLLGQGETGCLGYVHSIKQQAEAVAEVLKQEQVESFAVIGHSMGGYVALELAKTVSAKIDRLVMFHSTALPDSKQRKADRERVIELAKKNKEVYVKAVIPSLFAENTRSNFAKEISNLAETASQFPLQGIIANIEGMKERPSYVNVLEQSDFPKLIIHGEMDPIISISDIHTQIENAKNAELKIIPNVGHMGHIEAPEICLEIIQNFINA